MKSPAVGTRPCPQCGTSCSPEHHYCPTCGFPVGTLGDSSEDRFIGQTLPGGYHILDLISIGGMGRVYRAEQSALGRTVAVKIIHPHLLADENSVVRFMTEARAASRLNHPNSIAVFDFGRTDDGQPYLVMEFLRGKDLARIAYEDGPLPIPRIINVLQQVLAALAEAHDLGIIHRDLKPENVILEPMRRGGDFVKVLDFGLAKLKAEPLATNVTSPGIVCGTPDYMAPEQGRGDPIDGRSDLYAVGVILFQLLTGKLPFEAESPTQVVMMHLSMPVPDPRQVAPERAVPEILVGVVRKALAKDPGHRFQDALEFSDGLRNAHAAIERGSSSARPSVYPGDAQRCPTCGSLVPAAKFCLECGGRLTAHTTFPPAQAPPLPFALEGREDDLEYLRERRSDAAETLVGVRLVGDTGVGKTRLLREFLDECRHEGDAIALACPDPYWAEVAYYTVRRAVTELTLLHEDELLAHAGAGLTPAAGMGLAEMLSLAPGRDARRTPTLRRHAVAEALRWALHRAVRQAPSGRAVLAIDDLHRVDPPSRQAFADVLSEPMTCGVLVVGCHTAGFDPQWGGRRPARVLEGIRRSAAARLLPPGGSMPALDGHDETRLPLHLEQLVRYYLEGGSDPPRGLADLMARRLDDLRPNARRALQALAVLGNELDETLLGRAAAISEELESALGLLERRGMVERGQGKISTSHPLLREVVQAGTPAAVRRELHARALALSDERAAPLEARALHAYHAQDSFRALLLLEQVAEHALARGDTVSEVLALRRGLEIARREISRGELDDPLSAVLIFGRKLGAALTRAGSFADAEGVLREALDVAGPSGADRARVLGALAHVARGRQRSGDALDYMDQAIQAARESGAHDLVLAFTDTRRVWAS
jgi:tetratricopeptide (TPR) repeat protein